MMKSEFIERIGRDISQEDWEIVEMVYMNYPKMDKTAVFGLYSACGLVAFKDLLPRATAVDAAEAAIRSQQQEIRRLQEGGVL